MLNGLSEMANQVSVVLLTNLRRGNKRVAFQNLHLSGVHLQPTTRHGKQLALVAPGPTGFLEIVQSERAFPDLGNRRACFHNRPNLRANADLQ